LRVLWRTVGYWNLFYGLCLYALFAGISFGPVTILNLLTQDLQGTKILRPDIRWILVALLFVLPVLGSVLSARSNVIMQHLGIQIRNVLVNAIYRKSLRLSPSARQISSTGQIVNMFSNDTNALQRFIGFMNVVALAPAQIAVGLALLYEQLGPAMFTGLALIVVMVPLSGVVFGFVTVLRFRKLKWTDKRVKLMNEILSGIRIIKSYAWEVS